MTHHAAERMSFREFADLLGEASESDCDACDKRRFSNWENSTPASDNALDVLGEFADADEYIALNGYAEYHPGATNYWSEDAPIALRFFPYHESAVSRCPRCRAIFLSYIERAGHAPQKRLRWVRRALVFYGDPSSDAS